MPPGPRVYRRGCSTPITMVTFEWRMLGGGVSRKFAMVSVTPVKALVQIRALRGGMIEDTLNR